MVIIFAGDYFVHVIFSHGKKKYIHSREIETLHFFNGKYTRYCLKY